jgi:retinol-binding protein 3
MKLQIIGISMALAVTALAASWLSGSDLRAAQKTQTVEAIIETLRERYIFPELAEKAEVALRAELKKGTYDSVADGKEFAALLTQQLRDVVNDAHMGVRFSEEPLPARAVRSAPSQEEVDAERQRMRVLNAGVDKVERLAGNVGYLELRGFMNAQAARRPIKAAMEFLGETDALIIDLRQNGGGSPETVRLLSSYFFDSTPVHLNTLVWRDGTRDEFWTLKEVDGPRYLGKEIYVLVSKRTASAAEEFSYNFKNLKRATILGENTWGGANPGGSVRLNDHFSIFVPTGRAENPISKTNWEGVGVEPDVKIPPAEALAAAHVMALEKLLANETSPAEKKRLESALEAVRG